MSDNKNVKLQSENTKSNFGKGWIIIFFCMFMFWFLIGYSIDGQNIVIDAFANTHWEELGFKDATALHAELLNLAFYAGLIGVVAYFILGRLCVKMGGRLFSAVFLALAGLSYIYYGHATTTTSYFIGLTLVTIFINGAAYLGGGNLVTQWFPKKKGLANGYTTMGHNLGSALYVPLIAALIGGLGMANGMTVTGVLGIACSCEGCQTKAGNYQIDLLLANVCKQNITRFPYEIVRLAEDIAGGLMVTLPSQKDFDSPVVVGKNGESIGEVCEKYFKTRDDVPTEDRNKVLRLLENLCLGTAAVGYRTESMHGAGSPQAQRIMISRQGNIQGKKQLAKDIAGIKE